MITTRAFLLREQEELLLEVRSSLFPYWSRMLLAFLWLVIPFFLLFPLLQMRSTGLITFAILFLSGLAYAYGVYRRWSRTAFFVTDQRVVDIDQPTLFRYIVSEADFDQIEDVSVVVQGFWPTLLRYGTLELRIQGSAIVLKIFAIKDPNRVQELINALR